jgi:hypothetical protein
MTFSVADPSNFIDAAVEGLRQQTSAHTLTWHLGQEQNWAVDLDAGIMVLTFANGTTATAAIQVVGTYNTLDGTFLWGWDHPSVPEQLRDHARLGKRYLAVRRGRESSCECERRLSWAGRERVRLCDFR